MNFWIPFFNGMTKDEQEDKLVVNLLGIRHRVLFRLISIIRIIRIISIMSWLIITLIAYLLNAIAAVIDKTMLKKNVLSPISYVFSIAMLGAVLILFVLPFGFTVPNLFILIISLIAGAVFTWGLILLFQALQKDEATRTSAMIGGLVPIFVFILAWYVLEEKLTSNQYLAFIFLIVGIFLMALDFQERIIRKTLWIALPASVLFAVSHVLTKFVYINTDFLSGFVWTRLGAFISILVLLISAKNRAIIKRDFKKNKNQPSKAKSTTFRFLFGQACGGGGAILIQYAIFLGSVTLVNALQGAQYGFVFILAALATLFLPKLIKETISREIIFQKILAILIIGIGLYLIAV